MNERRSSVTIASRTTNELGQVILDPDELAKVAEIIQCRWTSEADTTRRIANVGANNLDPKAAERE